jgi:hypothetical protein
LHGVPALTRAIILTLALALSGCGFEVEKRGYVIRSVSVDAAPGMISGTVVFDNYLLPESSGCLDVCVIE